MQLAVPTGLHEFDELSELRLVGLANVKARKATALVYTIPLQFG